MHTVYMKKAILSSTLFTDTLGRDTLLKQNYGGKETLFTRVKTFSFLLQIQSVDPTKYKDAGNEQYQRGKFETAADYYTKAAKAE